MSVPTERADYLRAKHFTDTVRTMIVHEDELVNQRLGWLLTVQTALLATLAFSPATAWVNLLLATVGIVSSCAIWRVVARGRRAIDNLFGVACKCTSTLRELEPDSRIALPPTIGIDNLDATDEDERKTLGAKFWPIDFLPMALVVLWAVVAVGAIGGCVHWWHFGK